MLLRIEHMMTEQQCQVALNEFERALTVRKFMPRALSTMKTDHVWVPSCHAFAHAYGKAFGMQVVDGEIAYPTDSKLAPARWLRQETIELRWKFIKHSWIEFDSGGRVFILDIFPEATMGVSPVLHEYPHPSYYVPEDSKHRAVFAEMHGGQSFKESVTRIAALIREIAQAHMLL